MEKEKFDFRELSKIAKQKIETEHPGLKESNLPKFIDLWKNECIKMLRIQPDVSDSARESDRE